jgi:hypothetical protein
VDCQAEARNARFPAGVTAEAIASDPYAFRPEWVNPKTYWDDLEKMLTANPVVGPADAAVVDQARTLIALRKSNANYKGLLDRAVLAADASLHASSRYEQVGVDAGNGWQRQENGGVWGSDWFGRAQAAVYCPDCLLTATSCRHNSWAGSDKEAATYRLGPLPA